MHSGILRVSLVRRPRSGRRTSETLRTTTSNAPGFSLGLYRGIEGRVVPGRLIRTMGLSNKVIQ